MTFLWIILALIFGAAASGAIVFFMQKSKLAAAETQIQNLTSNAEKMTAENGDLRAESQEKSIELAKLQTLLQTANQKIAEKSAENGEQIKKLTTEFENIANKVLKARAAEFSETSEKNLGAMLTPLSEKIKDFHKLVNDSFEKERLDKVDLRAEIRQLAEQNVRISNDAQNLTKALKGDVKKQGNWGEMLLERVLEMSGLRRGFEYEREEAIRNTEGAWVRPDVIVHLPDNKHIIIDSKVSLTAYDRLISATEKEEYDSALKEHLLSIKKHVAELAAKSYQNLPGINAPDFVLMFVPNEAMFSVAVDADQTIMSEAWEKRIVIVSPTTLLATLRTISSIWKQEIRTKNAEEIARIGGTLYDKLSNFLADMEKIKKNIDNADKAYDDAIKKLSTGAGNAITTAEKLKKMGAKVSKELPAAFKIDENELLTE